MRTHAAIEAPIFIVCDFRSGSTLLRYALDAHPEICCPAELNLAEFCQEAFRIVELTTDDDGEAENRGGERIDRVRELVDVVMTAYCRRRGRRRWCEKSPANLNLVHLLGTVFADAQYICLYRHGLDQIHSFLEFDDRTRFSEYYARRGGDEVSAAVDRWCARTERLLAFEHWYRAQSCRIRYEDLVVSPDRELGRLAEFLSVANEPGWSGKVFDTRHDRGPADSKIKNSNGIDSGRRGKGRCIDLHEVPGRLQERFTGLLERLGYHE